MLSLHSPGLFSQVSTLYTNDSESKFKAFTIASLWVLLLVLETLYSMIFCRNAYVASTPQKSLGYALGCLSEYSSRSIMCKHKTLSYLQMLDRYLLRLCVKRLSLQGFPGLTSTSDHWFCPHLIYAYSLSHSGLLGMNLRQSGELLWTA